MNIDARYLLYTSVLVKKAYHFKVKLLTSQVFPLSATALMQQSSIRNIPIRNSAIIPKTSISIIRQRISRTEGTQKRPHLTPPINVMEKYYGADDGNRGRWLEFRLTGELFQETSWRARHKKMVERVVGIVTEGKLGGKFSDLFSRWNKLFPIYVKGFGESG